MAVDHRGHGRTGGDVGQSSLKIRVDEVLATHNHIQPRNLLGSVAMSMGGHVSLKRQQVLHFDSVVLIALAVYSSAAYELPFGHGFTEKIREPESWRDNDVWTILRSFSGRLLTVIG